MSIAALIRSMAEAGAPAEAIALAVEAIEAANGKLDESRAASRERKRRQRERDRGVTVTGQVVTERDTVSPSPSPPDPPNPAPIRESIYPAREAVPTRTEIARGFLAFWQTYPKRVGKDAAAKSFERAMRRAGGDDPLETILSGLRRALPGWDDPQFIPNPTTWLNQGRWTDETPAVRGPDDRPANDYRRSSHSQPSRAERDQSAALEVLARRGALPRQDLGGDIHDLRPAGAQGSGGGSVAYLPPGYAA